MMKSINDDNFKIILIGDSGVGKSSLLIRYMENKYINNRETIGIDHKYKSIEIDGKNIKLSIWDTAGQERFRPITKLSYKETNGIIYVFDLTNIKSFQAIFDYWIKQEDLQNQCNNCRLLVGTKSDLENKNVSQQMINDYVKKYSMLYIEVSAKTGKNIPYIFDHLVNCIIKQTKSDNFQDCSHNLHKMYHTSLELPLSLPISYQNHHILNTDSPLILLKESDSIKSDKTLSLKHKNCCPFM